MHYPTIPYLGAKHVPEGGGSQQPCAAVVVVIVADGGKWVGHLIMVTLLYWHIVTSLYGYIGTSLYCNIVIPKWGARPRAYMIFLE